MSGSKTQPWNFGDTSDDEEPEPAIPRETLVQKTRAAARKVGYGTSDADAAVDKPKSDQNSSWRPPSTTGRPRGNRTKPLATKITAEQDALLKAISSDGMVIADIVSEAMKALAREVTATGRYKRLHLDEETLNIARAVLSASEK